MRRPRDVCGADAARIASVSFPPDDPREALEESGIVGLRLHPRAPRPLVVDVHDIPARGDEPAHQHLDLRYLVVAPALARIAPELSELHEIRWVAWDETEPLAPDHGLRRALQKARAFVAPPPC